MPKYETGDRLICFLYILGRDHLTLGAIAEIMGEVEMFSSVAKTKKQKPRFKLSNLRLAQYSVEIAERLRKTE